MEDEQWKYLLDVTCISGRGEDATRFQWKTYANDLLVPFYNLVGLYPANFDQGNRSRHVHGPYYEQAKLIHQPSKEVVAITRHYPPAGHYFFAGPGLYLEYFVPLQTLEKIMGVSFSPLASGVPDGFLQLGAYNEKKSSSITQHDGVMEITEQLLEKRFEKGVGIFDLDIYHRRSSSYRGTDTTYSFDTIREAVLALVDQDLTHIAKPVGIGTDPSRKTIAISRVGEPYIELERHPPFLDNPVTGVPGIFYTVSSRDTLNEILANSVDLSVLPHTEKDKFYFQVASYQSKGDDQPTPVPALATLRQQLSTTEQPKIASSVPSYRVDYYYQVAGKTDQQKLSASFETAHDATRALTAISPEVFDAGKFKQQGKFLARVELRNATDQALVASMFKARAAKGGLPAGIYIVVDKERVTPALASAMSPILSRYGEDSHHHFLVVGSTAPATVHRKHPGKPRVLTDKKDTGKHL